MENVDSIVHDREGFLMKIIGERKTVSIDSLVYACSGIIDEVDVKNTVDLLNSVQALGCASSSCPSQDYFYLTGLGKDLYYAFYDGVSNRYSKHLKDVEKRL